MGTYRVELTFDLDDEALNDLVVQRTGLEPALPPPWPQLPPLDDDLRMELVSSALSLDNRHKVFNLLSSELSMRLGTWRGCPVRLSGPGLQVVDLADPDQPPMPSPKGPAPAS